MNVPIREGRRTPLSGTPRIWMRPFKAKKYISPYKKRNILISGPIFISISFAFPTAIWLALTIPDWDKITLNYKHYMVFTSQLYTSFVFYYSILHKTKVKNKLKTDRQGIIRKNKDTPKINILGDMKSILALTPLAISAAFIFTLYYYNWIFDNNVGSAFQITSMRLSKDKYRLISATLMILTVMYLFLVPARALKIYHPYPNYQHSENKQQLNAKLKISIHLMISIAITTLLAGIPSTMIFKILNPLDYTTNALFFASFSFSWAQMKIVSPNATIISAFQYMLAFKDVKFKQKISLNILKILLIFDILFINSYLTLTLVQVGGSIAATGSNTENPMSAYSCVFSRSDTRKDPIAFGIIIESKDTSLHIFTPELDLDTKRYVHIGERGEVFPNQPLESHITLKENYIIEQYDDSKHNYDWKTGKCTHK
ncbi:hypothetical protein [Rothia mucilaginosa]|uniref:hypothetical protein n=1 Tax=Rothia mucilaginosa TaxID=43675 RepID=UPI0011AE3414|nr:hypothetical protein [Rothia mucilaginosa]